MKVILNKPLIFFDLETTGIDVAKDRIVEIALLKVMPSGAEESMVMRLNPTIPIPPEVTAVHGIRNEDVAQCPTFKDTAKEIWTFMRGADLAGYNSIHFDIPLLVEEFLRADVAADFRNCNLIDVQNIFHKMEQRTLLAAYKFYCGKELINAHSALADTRATMEVLEAQLDKYPALQNNAPYLHAFSAKNRNADYAARIVFNAQGEEIFNFGKYKGRKVTEVLSRDNAYYDWIMKSDFTLDTKRVLTQIRMREFGSKKKAFVKE